MLESYNHLHIELLQLKEDHFERTVFEYFDFIAWVESKLQNITFADVIRQRNLVEVAKITIKAPL